MYEAFADFGEIKNFYLNFDCCMGYVKGYVLVEYDIKVEV